MAKKLHIRKDDQVMIIAGNEKGKEGKVISIDVAKQRAIVEGRNMVSKHKKPTAQNADGGIEKTEAPIHVSNLMVIDAKGKATRTSRTRNEKGEPTRTSKKSGSLI